MARVKIKNGYWEEAREELKARGITLTRRKARDGGYVCYADKKFRAALSEMLYYFERERQ